MQLLGRHVLLYEEVFIVRTMLIYDNLRNALIVRTMLIYIEIFTLYVQ